MSEADVELKLSVDTSGMPPHGRAVTDAIVDELDRTRAQRAEPSHAQRRFLDRQMIAEWTRRRRGGTPADAAAQLAAEEKRARRRERNRA